MRLTIRVIPRSSKNEIVASPSGLLKARLTAPPVDGKANESLIKLLSEYYDVSKTKIKIVKGVKSKNKILEIRE
ncbi:MAG: DUF167 domain-containing protein [Candidatus Magasanikbacteria bacterium]|nr:DUF167 domain-containing protein [Candidatus Magasanikbacteria bacterium]